MLSSWDIATLRTLLEKLDLNHVTVKECRRVLNSYSFNCQLPGNCSKLKLKQTIRTMLQEHYRSEA